MKKTALASVAAGALTVASIGLIGSATASNGPVEQVSNTAALHSLVLKQGPYDGNDTSNLGDVAQGDGGWVQPRPTGPARPLYGSSAEGR